MEQPLSFTEHLEELRVRLIRSIVAVIIASCITYAFIEAILAVLIRPIGELIFIAPQEAFVTYLKIALFGGIFLASPVVIYQIWRFIGIGLRVHERRYAMLFGPVSFLLFVIGAVFGYAIIVPVGLHFLLGFATESIKPMITLSQYISFVGVLTLVFGCVYQLPLAMVFVTRVGLISPQILSARRREVIVAIFIVAALLTPPDVITQLLLAIPLLALFELGILFSKLFAKK
ncbi:MAG: twin-arginine translocase subunit TatC [Candidatus Omnitrophica bacterium]|nr:twin-arginine translocase subunit TatC [Candidatus Omnitrophota bacterium]